MGAQVPGSPWRHLAAAGARRRVGTDRGGHEGVVHQMSRHTFAVCVMTVALLLGSMQARASGPETRLPAGRFGTVTVYIPAGTPRSVAIFLSGDGGWHLGVINMARALTDMGAVVIGVDTRQYLSALRKAAQ